MCIARNMQDHVNNITMATVVITANDHRTTATAAKTYTFINIITSSSSSSSTLKD
jgi:hypothetical protein